MIHIFNPRTTPVVYSKQGHIIGGGEHLMVEALDSHGQKAVKRGYIVILPNAEEEESSPASAGKSAPRKRSATAKDESGEDSGASEGSSAN